MYQTDTNISFSFKSIVCLLGLLLVLSSTLNAQSFLNGDLNGTVGEANAPTSWSLIPFTDFVCAATDAAVSTVDLSDNTAPNLVSGVPSPPNQGPHLLVDYTNGLRICFYQIGLIKKVLCKQSLVLQLEIHTIYLCIKPLSSKQLRLINQVLGLSILTMLL